MTPVPDDPRQPDDELDRPVRERDGEHVEHDPTGVDAGPVEPDESGASAAAARGPRGRAVEAVATRIDKWFDRSTLSAGIIVLLLLGLVGLFLLLRSTDAFGAAGIWGFLSTQGWDFNSDPPVFGVLGMAVGTVLVALVAIAIAVPLGVCAALYITEYTGVRGRRYLTGAVDMLAAIPSLLFGIWGAIYFGQFIVPLSEWLSSTFGGFIPLFATDPGASLTLSIFIAGIVVALMTLPIVASVSREVFSQAPPGEREAALALGGTRWGMIRAVVLPYGRGGVIGGSMLGLGRALGETIAVALILPQLPFVHTKILQSGGSTVSGFIAVRVGVSGLELSGLMAAGLVLFVITLATNMVASIIVARSRSGAGVEI